MNNIVLDYRGETDQFKILQYRKLVLTAFIRSQVLQLWVSQVNDQYALLPVEISMCIASAHQHELSGFLNHQRPQVLV